LEYLRPGWIWTDTNRVSSDLRAALSFGTDARDLQMFVEVYTEQEGFDQARQIAARVYALTHGPAAGQPFAIPGFTHIMTMCVQTLEDELLGDSLKQGIQHRYQTFIQG
jgi:hypothetical protein